MNTKLLAATTCLVLGAAALPGLAQTSTPPAQQAAPAQQATPEIDSFSVQPVAQLTPGTELLFTLQGTPNAQASFTISGTANNLTMREVEPGIYTGRYTIRSGDPISQSTIIRGNLGQGSQISSVRLQNSLVGTATATQPAPQPGTTQPTTPQPSTQPGITATQLPLEVLSPANNTRIKGAVEVTGRSTPQTTINVKVRANNSLAGVVGINRDVFDRDIQTDAQGNFRFDFQPTVGIPGTRYEMSLSAVNGSQTQQQTLVLIQQ